MTAVKLTAVEWLEKEVKKRFGGETFTKAFLYEFNQAKKMEKEQMIEFACQVAEASAMKYIQGKTTRMIAEELITFKSE